jgi:hypothetical protein
MPWNSVHQFPRDSWPVEFGAVIFDQKNVTVVWEEIIVSHGLDSLIAMVRPCILSASACHRPAGGRLERDGRTRPPGAEVAMVVTRWMLAAGRHERDLPRRGP